MQGLQCVPGLYILHVRHFFLVRCLWKDGSSWLFWLICLALEALYEKLRLVIVGEFALCALHTLFISPNRTQSVLVVRPWVRESAILWQLWLIFDGMNVGRRIWANQLPYLLTVIDLKKLVQFWVLSLVCKWATVRDGGLSAQWHLLPNWRQ